MKYNDNGTYKDIYVKAFDTLPVGAIVEYSGSTIPDGWTDIGNNQIQKTSQYIEGGASLSNVYGTSDENGYTQEYINNLETYSTNEVRVGIWIDNKPLYKKTIVIQNVVKGTATTYNHNIQNVDTIFIDANSFYKFSGGTPLANMLNNYQNIDKQMTRTVATPTIIEYYVGDYVVSGTTDGYITVYYTKTTD